MQRDHALFVSDAHVGSRYARLDRLLAFLRSRSAHTLYLVGDVTDDHGDASADWDVAHELAQLVLHDERYHRVVVTPGNHDAWMHRCYGSYGRRLVVTPFAHHVCLDGRVLVVTHGHQFDWVVTHAPVLSRAASSAERAVRWLGGRLGPGEPSREARRVHGVNRAVSALVTGGGLRRRVSEYARAHRADGVVYGHFHEPGLSTHDGLVHADCGDWVDSCTAVAEGRDGLRMVGWGQ